MTNLFLVAVLAGGLVQDAAVRKQIQEGDAAYARRSEAGQADKSLATYKKALALDEDCEEACWKAARVLYWIGTHEKDNTKKMQIHKDGIEYAKTAISLNADGVPGHYWLGVHYGMFGEAKGIAQSLNLVDPIKKEMEWIIKKDEKYMQGGAHRVLGRMYFRLPGIMGGDNAKSLEHLKKALEIEPTNILSHIFVADVYIYQGKKDEARKELKSAVDAPIDPEWEPECKEQREEAKQKLKELGE